MRREFTVAVFVVHADRVLLLWHRQLRRWLPPGGHLLPNELPDEAARREVQEETGLAVELVGEYGLDLERPQQLLRPEGVQVEEIGPDHQHIDLIYFARPRPGTPLTPRPNAESAAIGWYRLADLPALGVSDEVQRWAARAEERVNGGRPGS